MKRLSTFIFLTSVTILTACTDKVSFEKKQAQGKAEAICDGVDYTPTVNGAPIVNGQAYFEVGVPTTMTYPGSNAGWFILLPDGEQLFAGSPLVLTIDELGNYPATVWSTSSCGRIQTNFTINVVPVLGQPLIAINNGDKKTVSSNVNLTLQAENAIEMTLSSSADCSGGSGWITYNTTHSWTLPNEGSDVRVYAQFRSLARTSECISDGILYDVTPPVIEFVKKPELKTATDNAEFEFSAVDNATGVPFFECKIDQKDFEKCELEKTFTKLKYGEHSVAIRATDGAGNTSEVKTYSWEYLNTAPVVTIVEAPSEIMNTRLAEFVFTGSDDHNFVRFECSLDNVDFSSCESPILYRDLADGNHTFRLRGFDDVGTESNTASHTWKVHIVIVDPPPPPPKNEPPVLTLIRTPEQSTTNKETAFDFEAADSDGTIAFILCRIDQGEWTVCTSPAHYTIPAGKHTFSAVAVDDDEAKSNYVTHEWEITEPIPEKIPPTLTITKTPDRITKENESAFEFSASDTDGNIAFVLCQIDGGEWVSCLSPTTYTLPVGKHVFAVYATDNDGLRSSVEQYEWEILKVRVPVKETFNIDVSGNKIDVLMVVDNSPSMVEEQKKMSARFANFISTLNGLDWQIGIITTDSRSGEKPYKGGKLLAFEPGRFSINSQTPNAEKLFTKTIVRKEWGHDKEQGIHSIYKALQRPENKFFFRDHSHLASVIISDEDENSNGKKLKDVNQPGNLTTTIHNQFPTMSYSNHSIVLMPGYNQKTCPQVGSNYFGATYALLTKMTTGVIGDICSPDYGIILKGIGDNIRSKAFTVSLRCVPVGDVDVQLTPNSNVTQSLDGNKLTLSPFPPVGTKVDVTYYCD